MSLMPLEFKARLIYYKINIILGVISYPNVQNSIGASNHFGSKCKWVARFNLSPSLQNSVFMNRSVKTILA